MKNFRNGLRHLYDVCPHMRKAMDTCGRPKSRKRDPGFPTLVRIIIDQQVSVQAGAAIWARLVDNIVEVRPEVVVKVGIPVLRESGLSGAKAKYVLGIAEAIVVGDLDLNSLARCREDTVRARLTALKGIGDWTADIYLMFALGRPDIWPVGDIAIRAAAGHMMGLPERPDAATVMQIGEAWRPYRTVAAVMLWHYYKRTPGKM